MDNPFLQEVLNRIRAEFGGEFKGEKGDRGESIVGAQGIPGKDGESIVGPMGPRGKDGRDGVDGIGVNGVDGKDADEEKIVETTIQKIKDEKLLSFSDLSDAKNVNERIDGLGKKGTGYKLKDQRWHGTGTSGSASIYVDSFTTTGGLQTVTLTHTPITVLTANINGTIIYVTTDYTLSGTSLNLLNVDLPAGLAGLFAYVY